MRAPAPGPHDGTAPRRGLRRGAWLLAAWLLAFPPAASAQADPVLVEAVWNGVPVVAGRVLVQFRPGTPAATQAARHAQLGTQPLAALSPTLSVARLPPALSLGAALQRYAALPEVQFAQPDVLHRAVRAPPAPPGSLIPSDTKWSSQWHLPKVRAPQAWELWHGDGSALVAILDSGVDVDHPDLDDHFAGGLDTFAGDGDPDDLDGHGTHCSGLAAAETDNAKGVAGSGWDVRFLAYRCGNTSFPTSALVPAIADARARGALVLSMSWGSTYNDPSIAAALQAAHADGCLLVAAAGNDGGTTPFYPAAHAFVLGVGASTATDARASFSNHGGWVDLAAPGVSLYSTGKNNTYLYSSGTSMACPLVAGVATMLYGRLPGGRSPANAALVRNALQSSAVPVGSWVAHGRLDARAALETLFPFGPLAIAGAAPASLPALAPPAIALTGSGFFGVTSAQFGGVPASFHASSDGSATLQPGPVAMLGPQSVLLASTTGASVTTDLVVSATSPPRLLLPAALDVGQSFAFQFGGDPGHAWLLLVALDPATFTLKGWPILSQHAVLAAGALHPSTGLASLGATIPPVAAGLTFHAQIVTLSAGLSGASAPVSCTVAP